MATSKAVRVARWYLWPVGGTHTHHATPELFSLCAQPGERLIRRDEFRIDGRTGYSVETVAQMRAPMFA